MSGRTWWSKVEQVRLLSGRVVLTSEPFFANGADSDVDLPCWDCGRRIGYRRAEARAVLDGRYVPVHEGRC